MPSRINQYHLILTQYQPILTQYHQVPIILLYCTDPVHTTQRRNTQWSQLDLVHRLFTVSFLPPVPLLQGWAQLPEAYNLKVRSYRLKSEMKNLTTGISRRRKNYLVEASKPRLFLLTFQQRKYININHLNPFFINI